MTSYRLSFLPLILALATAGLATAGLAGQDRPLRIFISVDMEGIGGIGTGQMTNGAGKDYATGRELMTEEVNTVVAAIFERGPAEILVNDSHGDMQNLLHTRLDPRVTYIQATSSRSAWCRDSTVRSTAPSSSGTTREPARTAGSLAHTGSGSVKGLWLNGVEVGEGGLNAHYARSHDVPILVAAGERALYADGAREGPS